MIAIVDYGLGNLSSIKNMFKYINVKNVKITSDREYLNKADKIILPGVGSFDNGMKNLKKNNLIELLNRRALDDKIPFLGICLGMQLMCKKSEEGKEKGLGWFDADVIKFKSTKDYKVPHMGWNYVTKVNDKTNFLSDKKKYRFYFVHSYYVNSYRPENVLFETDYNIKFHSGIQMNNLIGMQFHPEKSLHYGMDIFKIFSEI